MTLNKAKTLLTSIEYNLDGRMRYTYDPTGPESFKLKMEDLVSGIVRYLSFELKKAKGRSVDVEFTCDGFYFNFPLKKTLSTIFSIYMTSKN